MFWIFLALIILFAGSAVGAFYLYQQRSRRRKVIGDILSDVNPLAVWTYTPDEWRSAVEELSWGRADDGPVAVRISRFGVYFKTRSGEYVLPLMDGTRTVTFAGYSGGEGNPLKLRTRWREVTRDQYEQEQFKYYKEDFRVPVPLREQAAAQNVVIYFTRWLEDHPNLYAQLLPDDEPISVFGKDSF